MINVEGRRSTQHFQFMICCVYDDLEYRRCVHILHGWDRKDDVVD